MAGQGKRITRRGGRRRFHLALAMAASMAAAGTGAAAADDDAAAGYRWTGNVTMTDSFVHEFWPGSAGGSSLRSYTSTIRHSGEVPSGVDDDGSGNPRFRYDRVPVADARGTAGPASYSDNGCTTKVTAVNFSYPPVSTHVDLVLREDKVVYVTSPEVSVLLTHDDLTEWSGSTCESGSHTTGNVIRTESVSLELPYARDAGGRIRIHTTITQDFVGFGTQFSNGSNVVTRRWEIDLVGVPSDESLPACMNARDDDLDGEIDSGDPGCTGSLDDSELGTAQCDNGRDDDGDGRADYRGGGFGDPHCSSLTDIDERDLVRLTVRFDGPGRVTGGPGACQARSAGDAAVCTFAYPRGATARLAAQEFAPGAYLTWVGCAVSGATCTKVMDRDHTVTVRFDPVRSYAPRAYFDRGTDLPNLRRGPEDYGAMDPGKFFAASELHAYIPAAWRSCKDRFKVMLVAERDVVASARKLTVEKLKAGRYRFEFCRARGSRKERVNSARLTAPAARNHPAKRPRRSRAGFYLDLPKKYRRGVDPREGSGLYPGPPMPYEYMPKRALVYWFFFAFNDRTGDKHAGDWEHLAIRLDSRNLARSTAYYNHLCSADERSWSATEVAEGTHPVAYIAGGGHGIWPTAGITRGFTCADGGWDGLYDTRSRGRQWDTWTRKLVDARKASWYGLGVGWGREGGIGWGPLGPGPWKEDVIPPAW